MYKGGCALCGGNPCGHRPVTKNGSAVPLCEMHFRDVLAAEEEAAREAERRRREARERRLAAQSQSRRA